MDTNRITSVTVFVICLSASIVAGCATSPRPTIPSPMAAVYPGSLIPSPPGGGCLPFTSLVPANPRPETARVADVLLRAGFVIVSVENGRTTWRCNRVLTPIASPSVQMRAIPSEQLASNRSAPVLETRREAQENVLPSAKQNDVRGMRPNEQVALASPSSSLLPERPATQSLTPTNSVYAPDVMQEIKIPREDAKATATQGSETRALAERLLPDGIVDRLEWATDIVDAITTLNLPHTPQYLCATMAVIGQESGFQTDPVVPGLPRIAWAEIERRRSKYNVPHFVVDKAANLRSPNGMSYRDRINAVRTEKELSEIYEDFFRNLPILARASDPFNPIKTLGPMQVSIDFINEHVQHFKDKIPKNSSVRAFGLSRRGSILFGTTHLLDYAAPYDGPIYRFADYNAGRYASRNAAFQNAISRLSNTQLSLDGILLTEDFPGVYSGETLRAAQSLGSLLKLASDQITDAMKRYRSEQFENTELYLRVFKIADERAEKPLPRALVPVIKLSGPKIQRKNLSTGWFAQRVDTRYRACLARTEDVVSSERKRADKTFLAGW